MRANGVFALGTGRAGLFVGDDSALVRVAVLEGVEGLELLKGDGLGKDRAAIIARARKAAVMVMCY